MMTAKEASESIDLFQDGGGQHLCYMDGPPPREASTAAHSNDKEHAISSVTAQGLPHSENDPPELAPWRLSVILFCLCFALMLSSLETSIVATALVNIASSLSDYSASNWIVVSYMLTYTGFMIIYARLSDIYGRKPALLTAVFVFGAFSLGCGFASSMRGLIILRAFQGMGGSGIYSMVFAVSPEILPVKWFGVFSGLIGAVYACSSILGPILGGVIVSGTSWRWVFWLNVPCTVLIFVLLWVTYPNTPTRFKPKLAMLAQIDWIGLALILGSSILIVFALEQAGTVFPWDSAVTIATLTVGVALLPAFVAWEIFMPRIFQNAPLPAFPLRLFRQRILVASFLSGLLMGFPFTTTLILLPSRYQIVQALSPLAAGIRMLPLLLSSALGSGLGGAFARLKYGSACALIGGSMLAVVGMGLMSSLSSEQAVEAKEYGFLVILGLGFGTGLSSLIVVARSNVGPVDSAILMATLTQIRVLGGSIGLAVSNALITAGTQGRLEDILSPNEIEAVRDSAAKINGLPTPLENQVRHVYGAAFDLNANVMLGIAGVAALASLGVWSNSPRSLADVKEEQVEWEKEQNRRQEQ